MRKRTIYICAIMILIFYPLTTFSDLRIPANPGKDVPVKQIGPDIYKIGGVTLNKTRKEIYISGSINMQSGLIEYFACSQAEEGKLHESLLKLEVKPFDLQVALLLLGLKHENNLKFQGDSAVPQGDFLEIWVEWELSNNSPKRVKAEELI